MSLKGFDTGATRITDTFTLLPSKPVANDGVLLLSDKNNKHIIWFGSRTNLTTNGKTTDAFPLESGQSIILHLRHLDEIYARIDKKNKIAILRWVIL